MEQQSKEAGIDMAAFKASYPTPNAAKAVMPLDHSPALPLYY